MSYADVDDLNKNFKVISNALNEVHTAVSNLEVDVSEVRTTVGQVSSDLSTTREELLALSEAFNDYVQEAHRTAAVQRAETKMGNLKAELDRQYGHYSVVRRTSVGVLQAFDVANVSDKVVTHVSEELMIQSPRYWLAPALVGIAAWSRDDKEICDRSIQEAFKRNPAKTSLFFALVLRRMGRNEAALRWLRHYLQSCTSSALTREFAVILESAAQGAFGPQGALMLSKQLKQWNDELRLDDDIVRAQVEEWKSELDNNAGVLATDEYPELRALSPEFPQLEAMLNAATALGATTKKYQAVKDNDSSSLNVVADMLDDLLEQLVTEYDDEELPLRREVAYNEAIIETDGDMKRAKQKASQYQRALEETVDAVTLQTRTAITPDLMGVSVQTQKVSIGAGQSDFITGLNEYTKDYRSKVLTEASIVLDENHSYEAQTFGFVGYRSNTSEPEPAVISRLQAAWDSSFNSYIQRATFKPSSVAAPVAITAVVVLLALLLVPVFGVLLLLGGGGGLGYWIYDKKKKADAEVATAYRLKAQAFEESQRMLLGARAAFFDLQLEFKELDKDEEGLRNLIETWPTAQPAQASKASE